MKSASPALAVGAVDGHAACSMMRRVRWRYFSDSICLTCGETEIVVDGGVVNASDEVAGARERARAREIDRYAGTGDV
jgi:hypothetical protein